MTTSYFQIVSAMVSNDLLSLVNTRPLKFWKETLALLCSVSFPAPQNVNAVIHCAIVHCK